MRYFSDMEKVLKEKRVSSYPRFLREAYWRCRSVHDSYDEALGPLIRPEVLLLDAGCGKKGIMEKYAGRVWLAVGTDLSRASLRENRSLDKVVLADACRLPFADQSFDVVLSQWLIEHVSDVAAVCAEFARVLRPGGHLIVVTNSVYHPMMLLSALLPTSLRDRMKKRVFPVEVDEDTFPTFYRCNTAQKFHQVLSPLGLSRVKSEYVGDVSVFLFSPAFLCMGLLYEKLTDAAFLRQFKMHIVAHYHKIKAGEPDARNRKLKNMDRERLFSSLLRCPECRECLDREQEDLVCRKCRQVYPVRDGIPQLVIRIG